ncbi:peroxisomal membrane protein 11D-like isoform X2 [Iris pallida]|uniref:Peroxisomal membrane protein 11D-like isoform X2 n=1 Tax=Iris pallida TaxID=29817 RepID=A0AAX6HAH5_IRIPA|nr:peroxisomal membrane protein 11D-like isoform X2 [Iris pallida]
MICMVSSAHPPQELLFHSFYLASPKIFCYQLSFS